MAEKELLIGFRLVNILEKQFSMFSNVETANQEINQNFGFAFGADVSDRLLACGCTYSLLVDKAPLLHIEIVCQFQVEEKKWAESLLKKKENKIVLPIHFAEHLASIVASTTRGVLYANTKNTELQKYPMSLINVHNILKEKQIEITL